MKYFTRDFNVFGNSQTISITSYWLYLCAIRWDYDVRIFLYLSNIDMCGVRHNSQKVCPMTMKVMFLLAAAQ